MIARGSIANMREQKGTAWLFTAVKEEKANHPLRLCRGGSRKRISHSLSETSGVADQLLVGVEARSGTGFNSGLLGTL